MVRIHLAVHLFMTLRMHMPIKFVDSSLLTIHVLTYIHLYFRKIRSTHALFTLVLDFSEEQKSAMTRAHTIMAPLKATFNCIIFVVLDADLRQEYALYFSELYANIGTYFGYDMTINTSLMRDGSQELSSVTVTSSDENQESLSVMTTSGSTNS